MSREARASAGAWAQWIGIPLLIFSCLGYGMALGAPLLTLIPGAGDFTGWLKALKPDLMVPVSYSLIGGILHLWHDRDLALAAILGLFCIVLPLLKFFIIWAEALDTGLGDSFLAKAIKASAPYAMVEVFVLALLVVVVKELPGGSKMELELAAWFFTASVLFSLLAAALLKPKKNSESCG